MLIYTTDNKFCFAVLISLVVRRSYCINKSFTVSKNMTNCYDCQLFPKKILLLSHDRLFAGRRPLHVPLRRVRRKKNVITFFQVMTSFLAKAQARHHLLRSNDNNNAAENDRRSIGACQIDIAEFKSVVSHKQSFCFSEDTNGLTDLSTPNGK